MRTNLPFFYRAFLLVFIAFSIAFSAHAQLTFDLSWRQGQVVLHSGDTLSGAVTLRHPDGILIVHQPDGSVSSFTAVNVHSFEVRGQKQSGLFRRSASPLDFQRTYQSFMWNHDKDFSNFRSPAFFIVLKAGKNSLLMREIKVRHFANSGYGYYQGARMMQERIEEKFYLLLPNQEVRALRNPKKDLPDLFPKHAKEIKAFARENKLSFNEPYELGQIINYVNSL